MKAKTFALLNGALALTMAGCGGEEASKTVETETSVSARVEVVKRAPVTEAYEAVGTVRSKTTSRLSSKIMGSVVAVHVGEGDRVQSGQVLVQIDNRDIAAQLSKARAGLNEAESAQEEVERAIAAAESARAAAEANRALAASTYQRFQSLLERRSVSQQEVDEVEAKHKAAVAEANRADEILRSLQAKKSQVLARIEQARADVANAQIHLGYANIASPISGVVTMKNVEVGVLASPGLPLITVEDSSAYRLEAAVEESQLSRIHLGDGATVTIDALGDMDITATVGEIVPAADPASRSFIVKLDLPPNPSLRSGLFGKARFAIGQKEALTIPSSALVERGQLTGVFVVDETDRARLRLVRTGKRFGDRIEILSGLNDGEMIVVQRVERVSDGIKIRTTQNVKRN